MNAYNDISSKDLICNETMKVSIAVKSMQGELFLDLRKWFKFPNQTEFFASKKGLLMSKSDWKVMLPLINQAVNED